MSKKIQFGIKPYDDGSGHRLNIRIGKQFDHIQDDPAIGVTVCMYSQDSDDSIFIDLDDWQEFKEAVDRNIAAYKAI
jgi:hypothetical protein